MNHKFIKIGIIVIVLISGAFIAQKTIFKAKKVHYHAGFQVYVNGKLKKFSDFKYMHEKPCTLNGKPLPGTHDDEQKEKAHLHDQTGDVVHVHRVSAKWNDLFTSIKYSIDPKAVGYINGVKVDNYLGLEIKPYDRLIIFQGEHKDDKTYLKNAVTKDRIKQVEKKSETCSS